MIEQEVLAGFYGHGYIYFFVAFFSFHFIEEFYIVTEICT